MERVSVVRSGANVEAAVRRSVELLGGTGLKGSEHVLVKPNVCNAKNPGGMVLTDFRVIKSVIDLIREEGCRATVVESNNIAGTAESRVKGSGLMALLDEWDVPFMNLSHGDYEEHQVAGATLSIPRAVLDADYLVNLPKMKTCAHTILTLGVKNLYGIFQQAQKSRYHKRLDAILPYLAKTVRCDLVIVDGLTCMEGNGPIVGNPVCLDIVVAGRNVVAVDSICSRIMGYDPSDVLHIAEAARQGAGPTGLEEIETVGDDWASCVHRFEPPYSLKATLKSLRAIKDVYLG
ncbi:hypothetical protein A3K69_00785 [Candidatus Bathyarchaeota archaeon RBG_16_57_9]|nr:MAG: hypothetical protein A3K69_00785 [Candidatus Bathyarchaeota archaeon RBG_16_57_9]OGD52276.1 MAG: hypothetical protein A3K81_01295 [Candidatus Bathyarchaeota archaeon RBG_13_60_20]